MVTAPVRRRRQRASRSLVGELVGASSPTQLATIVALDPIWVKFQRQ
jgi:hypothetical protein